MPHSMNTHLYIRRFISLCSYLLLFCQSYLFIDQNFVQRKNLFIYSWFIYQNLTVTYTR